MGRLLPILAATLASSWLAINLACAQSPSFYLAEAHLKRGNTENAIGLFTETYESDEPDGVRAAWRLAEIYSDSPTHANPTLANRWLLAAASLGHRHAMLRLGEASMASGDLAGAIRWLWSPSVHGVEDVDIYYPGAQWSRKRLQIRLGLARAFRAAGEDRQAALCYGRVLQLSKNKYGAFESRSFDEAFSYFHSIRGLFGKDGSYGLDQVNPFELIEPCQVSWADFVADATSIMSREYLGRLFGSDDIACHPGSAGFSHPICQDEWWKRNLHR